MQAIIRQKAQTAMQSAPSKSYAWTITWPNQRTCAFFGGFIHFFVCFVWSCVLCVDEWVGIGRMYTHVKVYRPFPI